MVVVVVVVCVVVGSSSVFEVDVVDVVDVDVEPVSDGGMDPNVVDVLVLDVVVDIVDVIVEVDVVDTRKVNGNKRAKDDGVVVDVEVAVDVVVDEVE